MKWTLHRLTRFFPTTRLSLLTVLLLASLVIGLGVWAAVETRLGLTSTRSVAPTVAARPAAAVMPMITATKTATRVTTAGAGGDVNGNGFVNPGDTLMYSVTVSNGGTDATGVIFTDQLNSDLTLVPGSVNASPIATNDSYSSYGNVGITVPAGSGVSANDLDPNGTTPTLTGFGNVLATANGTVANGVNTVMTTNNGTVVLSANGAFTYNPAAGFEGTDSFFYTISDGAKTDTAQVTITVSGMIWFVDNNAAACTALGSNCGRLSNPFSTLNAFHSINNGSGNNPASGDTLFIYRQAGADYTGPLTLLANQKVIGQGATASIASIAGITLPTFSNALPATSGTRPNLKVMNNGAGAHNLTVSTGNLLRGFNLENSATGGPNMTGSALFGTSFNGLTVSEVSVTSSANTAGNCSPAVNLDQSSGAASINVTLTSVAANRCTNGINLADTTGSFTVAGTGTAGSGGTIQNTTGNGITLSNTNNVSLSRMIIQTSGDDGINGSTVTGFSLSDSSVINNGNSTTDEGIEFANLLGTSTMTNVTATGNSHNNCFIDNSSGTMTSLTITGSSFSSTGTPNGNHGMLFTARLTAVVSAVDISNTTFSNNFSIGLQVTTGDTATIASFIVQNCTFSDTGTGNSQEISADFATAQTSSMTYKFLNNTITGMNSHAFNTFTSAEAATGTVLNATIEGNTIGTQATMDSGSRIGNGMRLNVNGGANARIKVNNNTIRQVPAGRGIEAIARNGTGGANFIITNNTIVAPTGTTGSLCGAGVLCPLAPIWVQTNTVTVANNACSVVSGNTAFNPTSFPGGGEHSVSLNETSTSQLTYEGNVADSALVNLQNQNPACVTHNVSGTVSVVAANTCTQPPMVQWRDTDRGFPGSNQNAQQNQVAKASSNSLPPGLLAQTRQWLSPVYAAVAASLGSLHRTFDKMAEIITPTVAAAEGNPAPQGAATKPNPLPQTLLVNRRGETRLVPTAALPKLFAGELITINGTGSGFTLPAGESTTIMFNATIGTGFTGTSISNQANVTAAGGINVNSTIATTDVIQAPNFSKAFSPTTIATNTGVSTLTFTLVNPNPSQSLSNVTFSDSLLNGLQVAATPNAMLTNCGGAMWSPAANATSLSFSTGSISAGGTCTVKVDVRSISEGAKLNTSGAATSTEANASGTASATLTVINAPTFSKAFGAPTVPLNGTTSLTFTITNNSLTSGLSGIDFTDTLPGGLIVATPSSGLSTTCNGTAAATAGGGAVSLSGASLAANTSCTLTVNVTGTTTGAKNNSATLATTELGASSATTGTVTLTVLAPPTISKAFGAATTPLNTSFSLTFTVTNPNASGTLTGVDFSDTLPAGLVIASGPFTASNSCGVSPVPTMSGSVGGSTFMFSGGQVTAGSPCTVSLNVSGTTTGQKDNTSSTVSSTEGGTNATPATASVTVLARPTLSKAFAPIAITSGGVSTLTITLSNPNSNVPLTLSSPLVDTLPSGVTTVAATHANTCGGTSSQTSGSVTLTGGTIPQGGSCTLSVNVTSTNVGGNVNTIAANSLVTNGGSNASPATATLVVGAVPAITKSFSPDKIKTGATSTMTIAITNNNASLPFNGVSFTDTLPAGLTVPDAAATSACGGTLTVASNVITLTGATIAAGGGVCTTTFTVTGATVGVKNNTVTVDTTNFGTGFTGNGTLTVYDVPTIAKSFSPTSVPFGGTSTMSFVLTNPNSFAGGDLTGLSFTDTLPSGITVANGSAPTCGGTLTTTAPSTVSFSGGTLGTSNPSNTCTINVSVTGAALGMWPNSVTSLTSTETGANTVNAAATLTVTASPTTTTITNATSLANTPTVVGESYAVNVTVAPSMGGMGTPSGTVNVSDGTGATCSITLSSGSGTCHLTSTTVGAPKTITASYVATTNFGASSTTTPHTVNPAATTTTITNSLTTATVVGEPYAVNWSVTVNMPGNLGASLTGNVTVSDGSGATCMAAVSAGTCMLTSTTPGLKNVTAMYPGDGNYIMSTSTPATPHTVNKASTTVAITDDTPDPSVFGQNYAVTAAVSVTSPGSGTPGGTITVTDGTNSCTITLPSTSCNLPSTSPGAKTLTATYNGDTNFNASPTSAGVLHTVNKADVNVAITSDNPDPSAVGQNVTVAFTVAAAAPGLGTPTGNVTITISGGSETCTGTLAAGSGSCTMALTVPGNRTLTATYEGDANFNTGTSSGASHVVVASPTIAKSFSPAAVPVNGTSTLTVTITNPAANTVSLMGVGFTDNFPAGLVVANPLVTSNTCGGTLQNSGGGALTAGATGIQLVGGTVGTGAPRTCTIEINVTPTVQGPFTNTISSVSSTNGGTNNTPALATLQTNLPPNVTPVAVNAMAGSPSSTQLLANNISDDMTPLASLTLAINGSTSATINSVTISNLSLNASGELRGTVVASCTATSSTGLFMLSVTDGAPATTTVPLNVTVAGNTPPTLSYANVAAGLNQTLIVMPNSGPSDNGSISTITASASAGFTGTVAVNQANGKVTLNNAGPLGTHTITVKATDNCGEMTTTTFQVTVFPFLVQLSDPIVCTGDNNTLSVHAEVTNPNNAVAQMNFNASVPPPLSGLANSCVLTPALPGVTCQVNANNVTVTGPLPANQTLMIDYKVKVADGTPQGTQLCIDSTASFNNGPVAMVQACTVLNCPPVVGNPLVSAQKAGSLLVFPYYTSKTATKSDTRLTISNISNAATTIANQSYAHLFLIDGASCQAADFFVCLTPNASFSFKASEYDPESTGWLLAVAVDQNGLPVQNNVLIGNAFVNDGNYVDNYGAESFRANSNALAVVNNQAATLYFDGGSYDGVPSQLVAEIQSPADAPGQRLVTVGLSGDLTTSTLTGAAQVGTALIYNGNEKPFGSFQGFLNGNCQAFGTITATTPRVPNGMNVLVPSGQVGSMKLNVGGAVGLVMTPRTAAWKGIRGLHKTAQTTATLTIPIFRPVC